MMMMMMFLSSELIWNPFLIHISHILGQFFFLYPLEACSVGIKRQHWSAIWVSLLLVNVYLPNHFALVTLLR